MNKKSRVTLYVFFSLGILVLVQLSYLELMMQNREVEEKKFEFVQLTGLPDLALSTDNYSSRHRSLSNIFEIYPDDGSLREYVYSSYAISHSHIHNIGSFNYDK